MRRTVTEILTFILASTIITVCTAVLGMKLLAPTTTATLPGNADTVACVDEPFRPTHGSSLSSGVGTLARLCFSVADVRPRLELTGVTTGTLFSAWLTNEEQPKTANRERCDIPPPVPSATWTRPMRIGAAVVDQTGRVQIAATLPGLRIVSGSRLQIVAVDHGWTGPERGAVRAEELLGWDNAWSRGVATPTGDSHYRGQAVGCASFWLRGGVDSIEQLPG